VIWAGVGAEGEAGGVGMEGTREVEGRRGGDYY